MGRTLTIVYIRKVDAAQSQREKYTAISIHVKSRPCKGVPYVKEGKQHVNVCVWKRERR